MDSPIDEYATHSSRNICFQPGDLSSEDDNIDYSRGPTHRHSSGRNKQHGSSPNIRFSLEELSDLDVFKGLQDRSDEDHVMNNQSPNLRFLSEDFTCDDDDDDIRWIQVSRNSDSRYDHEGTGEDDDDDEEHLIRKPGIDKVHNDSRDRNIRFEDADFSDEDVFLLNRSPRSVQDSMEEVRRSRYNPPEQYTPHSNSPGTQPHHPSEEMSQRHNAYVASLLKDKNGLITKEDLALFAQMMSDQYKSEQKIRLAEIQRLHTLSREDAHYSKSDDEADSEDEDEGEGDAEGDADSDVDAGMAVQRPRAKKPRTGSQRELSSLVRKFAERLMKRPKPVGGGNLVPIKSVSVEEVKSFLKDPTNAHKGPTADRFFLEFNDRAGPATPWNKRAIEIFTQEFLKAHPGHPGECVATAFKTHMFHLKNVFNRYNEYVEHASREGDEAAALASHENNLHIARMSRRKSLRDRRLEACLTIMVQYPDLRRLADLWKGMPVEAISGDESDHHQGINRYVVTKLPWRAAWVHNWMLVFDRLHLFLRFSEIGRATRGAFPHVRMLPTGDRIDRECITPPIGLPSNFYCPDWLSEQTPAYVQSLRMTEPIDISFSDEISR